MRRLTLIIAFTLLFACEDDEFPVSDGFVPDHLQPLVERFMWEAEKRGIGLDTSGLRVEFERNIQGAVGSNTVVGICTTVGNQKLIKLDTLNSLWLLSGNLGREEILFHELGHCLLGREHKDTKLASGDYASIMRSVGLLQYGDLNSYTSLFTGPVGLKAYRRDYYINELFDESTPVPCWSDPGIDSPFPVSVYENDIINNNEVRELWLDPEDNLWLYGREKAYIFDNGNLVQKFPELRITSLTNDNEGNLWIAATKEEAPLIATYREGSLETRYLTQDFDEDFERINRMLVDNLGRIWISENRGNLQVDSGNGFERVNVPEDVGVSKMKQGPGNQVYMLVAGRLYQFEDQNTFTRHGQDNSGLPRDFFWNFEIDREGTIWLMPSGSGSSLVRLGSNGQVRTFGFYEINLAETRVNSIITDAAGNLWVATSNGIKKWEGTSFSSYCQYNTGISLMNFNSIAADGIGKIWSIGRDEVTRHRQLLMSAPGL